MRNGPILLLATILTLAICSADADARAVGVVVADRCRITAYLQDGDVDAYAVPLTDGGRLSVFLRGSSSELCDLGLRLFTPGGREMDLEGYLRRDRTRRPRLRRFPVPPGLAGRWKLLVTNHDVFRDEYTIRFRVKPGRRTRERGMVVSAGVSMTVKVAADSGATLRAVVRERSGPPLASVRLLDPSGSEVAADFARKGRRLVARGIALAGGLGYYRIEMTGSGAGETAVDVRARVRYPRSEREDRELPPEAGVSAVSPTVVRQGGTGLTVEVEGGCFLAGSEAAFSGEGLPVRSVDVLDGNTARVTLDVVGDAEYGPRDLVWYPPEELGEPVLVPDAVAVHAPDPVVASVEGSPVSQGAQGAVLELVGTGLRDGGRIELSRSGVEVSETEVLGETRARVELGVDLHAPIGSSDITYHQPAAGGGASITLDDAFEILYPHPVIESVVPEFLRIGQAATTVTLHGRHFRPGGAVSLGEGVLLSDLTLLSDTELCVTAELAADAASGPRDVAYEHKAEGGGAATVLPGAFEVLHGFVISDTSTVVLTADDAFPGDEFGVSVGLGDGAVLVGAHRDDDDGEDSGSAYVFALDAGEWSQQAKLTPKDGAAAARFGTSVAIDGGVAVVGAPGAGDSGAVYVFVREGASWSQAARLADPGGAAGDDFGRSVAIDGDTVVVGAPGADRAEGAVYVFVTDGSGWTREARIKAKDAVLGDGLGRSVAIDGDTLAAGAPEATAPGTSDGFAYLFARSGGVWSQASKQGLTEAVAADSFGWSVALHGNSLVAGAVHAEVAGREDAGSAFAYRRGAVGWTLDAELRAPDPAVGDMAGHAVAVAFDIALVSAPFDDPGGADSGSVSVFARAGGEWSEVTTLAPAAAAGDGFGVSVAIDASWIAVGSYRDDDAGGDAGSVHLHEIARPDD